MKTVNIYDKSDVIFERISADPAVLRGKPCIKGTRISVEFIVELIASVTSPEGIVQAYPHLSEEDVEAAVRYAAK
ncbi:MAG: DUF433 domain-containing protein [Armatimonadetes bacterium]|nr:DUF433 domain-containing protein [Armatimonadota bacterium]